MNSPPKLHKSLALLVNMAHSRVVGSGREAGRVLDHIALLQSVQTAAANTGLLVRFEN